ncbi:MAG: sodium:proton antiporter [Cyanobacteria bacterium QS_4_48_99]|nr:MAG: sodium:proton antiporter [Cyanobacteria bacterium QS_4_48_99]
MLASAVWILLAGFFAGQIARRLGAPPLIGMILAGILLGPQVTDTLSPQVLDAAGDLFTVAVMIILFKAGLGLDRENLSQQGTVALRLGFLPSGIEAVVIAIAAMVLFNFDILTGLLMGCVLAPESPATIVPGMMRLKSFGWGVNKAVPDSIMTASALSDVLLLLVFGLLLSFLSEGSVGGITLPGGFTLTALQLLPFKVVLEIALGLLFGYLAARLLVLLLNQHWAQNAVQEVLITAGIALFLVIWSEYWHYFSGYLAAMSMGFFVLRFNPPLARHLRTGFETLWVVAEIVLFVLMGAIIQLQVLVSILLPGLLLLAIGIFVGRAAGWYISTLGSNWNWREKLFLLPGHSAKATVQAAIAGLPLAQGIEGGEIILAVAALAILVTSPAGAWGIPTFAPKLLSKGKVDPTKVDVDRSSRFLAAVDTSAIAERVLMEAAELARCSDGEVVVLNVANNAPKPDIEQLRQQAQVSLSDIPYQFVSITGSVPEAIVNAADQYEVTEIVMGKRGNHVPQVLMGSVSKAVLETTHLPVIIVEEENGQPQPSQSSQTQNRGA